MRYLTHSADAANILFQVVDHRYLYKKPMLFTTNKPLGQRGQVLHNPNLAEAIFAAVTTGTNSTSRSCAPNTRKRPASMPRKPPKVEAPKSTYRRRPKYPKLRGVEE